MKVCVISLSPLAMDPRVLRQIDALISVGHDVQAVGLRSQSENSLPCDVKLASFPPTLANRLLRLLVVGLARILPGSANALFWYMPETRALWGAARKARQADLYLANDWTALPLAARLAEQHGGEYIYDSHEFGPSQVQGKFYWRLLFPSFVKAVEGRYIHGARFVSCVSSGIARALADLYKLKVRPIVVRNVPPFREMPFRPVGEHIYVLYHGLLKSGRGLEEAIASVALWRPEFRLVIRGFGKSAYEAHLRELAQRHGVEDRVEFAPPVSLEDLIDKAAEADIGLFCSPGGGEQYDYVLPNKLFEYTMAGIALCVTGHADMKRIVDTYENGCCTASERPEDIAAVMNSLQNSDIERFKHHSLRAAQTLCSEVEYQILLREIERIGQ